MVVEKRGNKWCTYHCSGSNKGQVIACFPTKEAAERQHSGIMASKYNKIEININKL